MKKTFALFLSVAASLAMADSPNDHFSCFATQFFGRLQVEVKNNADTVTVKIGGYDAGRAALSLGIVPQDTGADFLEVAFQKDWCALSPDKLGVVSCEVPSSAWPRPTLPVTALGRKGEVLGKGVLSVYQFSMEKTHRIAASRGGDFERDQIELDAWLISETDNAKRAKLHLPYVPTDCKVK